MAEERKFSELTLAAVLTDADILAISQIDSATTRLMSKRTTLLAIAEKLASATNYTGLSTQDKTLTGAINELKGLIALIPHFSIEVVQTLPVEDISETTIYLTPSQNPETEDAYDEFIYVNDAWEHVGSTAVDLSAYYTKLEVDGLLATKANTADVSAALALKENTADLEEDVTDIIVDLTDTQETAAGNPVTLSTVQAGFAKSATVTLTPKQSGSGDPSPENIRPIEGHASASVTRTGKNQLDPTTIEQGGTDADGNLVNSNIRVRSGYNKVNSAEQYAVSVNEGILVDTINYYTSAKSFISRSVIGQRTGTATTPANTEYMLITFKKQGDGRINPSEITQAQLELGSTATSYEPYDKATATAEFDETIYGAQGDIAGGEWGKTWSAPTLNDLDLAYSQTLGYLSCELPIKNNTTPSAKTGVLCEAIKEVPYNDRISETGICFDIRNNSNIIEIRNSGYTSVNDFKAAFGAYKICYELATPEPFQTAPAPLSLKKGDNTITTDGDTVKVKYNKLALPDIGSLAGYIGALEARVAALEGGNTRSLAKSVKTIEEAKQEEEEETEETTEEKTEEETTEEKEEPKEETKK